MKADEISPIPTMMDIFEVSLPIIAKHLKLPGFPQIKLRKRIDDKIQPTFGRFINGKNVIELAIEERHPIDIIRTLAHEMVHFKQNLDCELDDRSGDTGSWAENEAHELAGIIMREIDKKYPGFFDAKAVQIKK